MNHFDNAQPLAIIIGLDSMQGLQAARILASHKVPVIGIASNPKYYSCQTRVCQKIIFAETSGKELLNLLKTIGPHLRQPAVLFPCHEEGVLLLSRYRQELAEWYRIILAASDVVEMMIDKIAFYTYAQQNGFPIPKTYFLYSRAEAEHAAKNLCYPCILKPPRRFSTWTQHTKRKALKATNAAELLAYYDHYQRWTNALIAQEWIEGPDANLYSCNCYFDANAEPLVTFVARKLRQWPPEIGQSCLGEECQNTSVLHETVRLFHSVNFRGLGYLEMKRDERSGKHFIIEPNIGRPTGRSAIAEASGVELLYTMYCDAVGWPLPANREQKYRGVKWIHFLRDVQSALYYWRAGKLTWQEWRQSLYGHKVDAIFSWYDPLPFMAALYQSIPQYLSSRERGKEDLQLLSTEPE